MVTLGAGPSRQHVFFLLEIDSFFRLDMALQRSCGVHIYDSEQNNMHVHVYRLFILLCLVESTAIAYFVAHWEFVLLYPHHLDIGYWILGCWIFAGG